MWVIQYFDIMRLKLPIVLYLIAVEIIKRFFI